MNLAGCTIRGCYYPIGGDKSTVVICEGWATAMSVHEATGFACAVSFGKGGLKPVAMMMKARLPDASIIVAADTDHVDVANSAALAAGGYVIVPEITDGTDFNDMHLDKGLDAVSAQFKQEPEQPAPDYKQSLDVISKVDLAGDREKLV
jgi:putative DNA primase/helicase